jgi:hypothetical protein
MPTNTIDSTAGIQRAINDASLAGGGTVIIPAGTYELLDALHMRSNVHVRGEGEVILRKAPSVESKIVDFLGYGHYEITVAEPEKFRVGMGIHITDKNAVGFYTTVATIIAIDGNALFIDQAIHHDYHVNDAAIVRSLHSLVEFDDVHNATLSDVILDGNRDAQSTTITGCRAAGIFMLKARQAVVRNVEVRHFHGDGISYQQCIDIFIDRNHLHHNTGGGVHPGSGTVRYLITDNHIHDNGACSIFYCLRTTHSITRNNHIHHNGDVGISVGERDTDHLIEGNNIHDNGLPGIDFRKPAARSGDRSRVIGNTLKNNSLKEGEGEIVIHAGLCDIHVEGNTITPATGKAAVVVEPGCKRISVVGSPITGDVANVASTTPTDLPPVGPEAAPADSARHLAIAALPAWKVR